MTPRKPFLVCSLLLICRIANAQAPAEKLPVPNAEARKVALKTIAELYKADYEAAKTAEERAELAKKILKVGRDSKDDATASYVLFRLARDIASSAGDAETALASIANLDELYKVDAIAMKAAVLTKVTSLLRSSKDHQSLALHFHDTLDKAIAEDRYDLAMALNNTALASARQSRSSEVVKRAVARSKEIKEFEIEYKKVKKAFTTLNNSPTEPDANLLVGKYQCFIKGDWEIGLTMLALGSHERLKALAATELEDDSDSFTLGNGWWDIAKDLEGKAALNVKLHAAQHYRAALPNLSGLKKVTVVQRLAEVPISDLESGGADAPRDDQKLHPKPVDLLADVDPARDGDANHWRRSEAGIMTNVKTKVARLSLPEKLPGQYDLTLAISISGEEDFSDTYVILPVEGKNTPFTIRRKDRKLLLSFWGGAGFGKDPKIGVYLPYTQGQQQFQLTFQVRKDRVSVLNGKKELVHIDDLNYIKRGEVDDSVELTTNTPTIFNSVTMTKVESPEKPQP